MATPWKEIAAIVETGDTKLAIEKLQAAPEPTAAYHYNLGTLLLREGLHGPALAHLEKALTLSPADPAVRQNHGIARQKLVSLIGESRLDPAAGPLRATLEDAPWNAIQLGLSALVLASALSVFLRYRSERSLARLASARRSWVLGGTVASLLLTSVLSWSLSGAPGAGAAMALEAQIVRSGPGERFIDLGRVEAGARIRLTGRNIGTGGTDGTEQTTEQWSQARFSPDGVGWVKSSLLLPL